MKYFFERDFTPHNSIDLNVYNANNGDYAKLFVNGQLKITDTFPGGWTNYTHPTNFKQSDKIYCEFYLSGGSQPAVMFNVTGGSGSFKDWYTIDPTFPAPDVLCNSGHNFVFYYTYAPSEATYFETLDKLDQWSKAQYDPLRVDSNVPF